MFAGSWNTNCIFEAMNADGSVSASCFANNTIFLRNLDPKTCNQPAIIGFQGGNLVCENGTRTVTREVAPRTDVAASAPATRMITATPNPAPDPPPAADDRNRPFAGEWDIVTERGDRFRLTAEQTGNAFVGTVPFGEQRLQMNGVVGAEKKLTLVWQIGSLAGTGELSLGEDGKKLEGQLQSEGGPIEGGTWTGTRPGSGPVALPLGETAKTAALPQTTTATPPDGFQTATVASAVSIRDKPRSQSGSKTVGSLTAGTTVSVRCDNSWCELADGRGWVWKEPLRFGAAGSGGGSTTIAKTTSDTASPAANFAGNWNISMTVIGSATNANSAMAIVQSGNNAEIRTQDGNFPATVNGRVLNSSFTKDGDRFVIKLTLAGSGNEFDGRVSMNGAQRFLWTGTRTSGGGAVTSGGTVQRSTTLQTDGNTRSDSISGNSIELMLDGLFNRRVD
jgi:hypothetical protein